MSHSYKAVSWNRNKLIYDVFLLAGIAVWCGHPNKMLA